MGIGEKEGSIRKWILHSLEYAKSSRGGCLSISYNLRIDFEEPKEETQSLPWTRM